MRLGRIPKVTNPSHYRPSSSRSGVFEHQFPINQGTPLDMRTVIIGNIDNSISIIGQQLQRLSLFSCDNLWLGSEKFIQKQVKLLFNLLTLQSKLSLKNYNKLRTMIKIHSARRWEYPLNLIVHLVQSFNFNGRRPITKTRFTCHFSLQFY